MRTELSRTWPVMSSPSCWTNAAASSCALTSGRDVQAEPLGLKATAVEERHLGVEFGAVVGHG
jgi:hypothetical protein